MIRYQTKQKMPSKIKKTLMENQSFENDESPNQECVENEGYTESDSFEADNFESTIADTKRKRVTDGITDELPPKKKKFENSLYKQPTVEELNQLRETENLFHSNLFRLQIEEALNETKLKDKYKKLFDLWFFQLKNTIESIAETEEATFADIEACTDLGASIPKPNIHKETKGTFKFLKPSNIQPIGSYNFDATVGPNIVIDVMVEMPSKMFQKLDYQNYRYLRKKAIYLAYIAASIQSDIATEKKYTGTRTRPLIKIIPPGKLGSKVTVLIHVCAEEKSFKLNRFVPEKNSIRPSWYFKDAEENDELIATPYYNSIVLYDIRMSSINRENAKIIREYPNIRDGIILLKIWLMQRELISGYDTFNGHVITMFVLYLLSIKKLNTFMSSYQIVRNVWHQLVHISWVETGLTMNSNNLDRVQDYKNYYDCVFLDSTGYLNIAAYISESTFSWVQREADFSLRHLEVAHADSFQSLFMKKVPFYKSFDHLLCIKSSKELKKLAYSTAKKNDKLDYGSDKRALIIKLLHRILKEGLTNRVQRICVLPMKKEEWDCSEPKKNTIGKIIIGLELNPDHCFGIVDKGPEANLPEAIKFRNFWGNKSDLRRFQDGTIREAVVWSKGKTLADRRLICKKIVKFLLLRKLKLDKKDFTYVADEVEQFIKLRKTRMTHFPYGTGEEASLKVIKVFESLEKELMSLTDVPLSIHGVDGSSPAFRYTDVYPPLATNHKPQRGLTEDGEHYLKLYHKICQVPTYVHPLEASLQLSTSGKWPDELDAIRKTKAAFHIQIAECLRKQCKLRAQGNLTHIDIMKEGFVFRLRVAHQKEIALLKQEVDEQGITRYRDNDESIELETKLFDLPRLNSALHGLHSQQPSFGAACRIAKRWMSAHLLDNFHMPDVAIELLVASIYLVPAPYKAPQMPQVAFLRLLDIFSRSHWNTDPVIVNFNNEMTKEEIVAVETLFASSRDTLPPLFISTPYDQQKSLWTRKAPTNLILNRISALAKESLNIFEKELFGGAIMDVKPMFRPSLLEYDIEIQLTSSMIPRKLQAIDFPNETPVCDLHPYKHHSMQKIPIVDFDPVQFYLKELRDGYGEFALFFHDTYGGTVITVLLRPDALEPRDFKVSNVNGRIQNNEGKLVLNVSAMIQDFYLLGAGLVEAIEIRSKKFSVS